MCGICKTMEAVPNDHESIWAVIYRENEDYDYTSKRKARINQSTKFFFSFLFCLTTMHITANPI